MASHYVIVLRLPFSSRSSDQALGTVDSSVKGMVRGVGEKHRCLGKILVKILVSMQVGTGEEKELYCVTGEVFES